MTASRGAGSGWRTATAAVLVVANLVLVGLNLAKHDLVNLSFGSSGGDDVEAGDTGPDPAAGSVTDETGQALTSSESTDGGAGATTVPPATDTTVVAPVEDDWPGGHGPVPDGPPEPRRALITTDGRMVLTGSAPDWATATKIVQFAGEKLPGGVEAIDNQLTWHPDANPSTQWGDVVMEDAAAFGPDQADIDPASEPGLDLAAQMLIDHPTVFAIVIGHADNQGDDAVNAQLAADRAAAVVDHLIGQGVVPGQIVVASAGEDDPMASNETAEGRAVNRRAEIQFKNVLIAEGSR